MSSNDHSSRYAPLFIACGVTMLVVLVRLWFAHRMNSCGVPDSCAYLGLAESLSKTHSFTERFLFDFQLDRLTFPTHGIEYWRPGTSFFFLLAQPFGGVTLQSSLVITILIGIVLALAAWRIAFNFTGDRSLACASYLLCLVLPPLWESSIIPDSGLFYAASVAWFLALFTVRFRSYLEDGLALACVSVAYMIRNDAVLLFVPLGVVLFLRFRSRQARGCSSAYCALLLAGFFAAFLPMHLIYAAILGTPLPSGSLKVLFMNDLTDFNRYQAPVTLATWLSLGTGALIKLRISTLPLIVYRILFLVFGFGIVFLPALWVRRNDATRVPTPESAPNLVFAATIVLVYSMVLPAVGIFSALRTSMGLLPFVAVCVVIAVRAAASSPKLASILTLTAGMVYFTMGVMTERRLVEDAGKYVANFNKIATFLTTQGITPERGAIIMTGDPVQFSEITAYPTIQLPSNGDLAVRRAAEDFKVTHILIGADLPATDLDTLRSALHPTATATVPGTHTLMLTLPKADRPSPK